MHLLDKVLVVHHGYLEVAARTKLLELVLEVRVQYIDAAAQASQKVVIDLRLELEVVAEPAEDLSVVLELGQQDGLQVGHAPDELSRLIIQVLHYL